MSDSPDAPLPIDPVLQFDAWLEKATPEEIEAAEPKYEADLIAYQKDRGREYILGSGERLYKYRAIVKKNRTRDWTKTVEKTMAISTAYDHINTWLQEYGHVLKLEVHNEADRPNPKVEEIEAAIKAAKAMREGLPYTEGRPELESNVKIPWPKVYAGRLEIDRFKEMRERDPDLFDELLRRSFYVLSQQVDPEEEKVYWGSLDSDFEIDLGLFYDTDHEYETMSEFIIGEEKKFLEAQKKKTE